MKRRLKPGTYIGSFYSRNGVKIDKYGNVTKSPINYRQTETGLILDANKKPIGFEEPHQHHYGSDPKKTKTLKIKRKSSIIFVRANRPGSLKPRSPHPRRR